MLDFRFGQAASITLLRRRYVIAPIPAKPLATIGATIAAAVGDIKLVGLAVRRARPVRPRAQPGSAGTLRRLGNPPHVFVQFAIAAAAKMMDWIGQKLPRVDLAKVCVR
jgi:hypothetical protein